MMEFHEAANLFPLLEGAEFEQLKADIAEKGLLEPIWLHDGKILDGRNRYRACVDLGIGPEYREWQGKAGGVAVDIGSIFDGWAGVVSRSHLRGREWAL